MKVRVFLIILSAALCVAPAFGAERSVTLCRRSAVERLRTDYAASYAAYQKAVLPQENLVVRGHLESPGLPQQIVKSVTEVTVDERAEASAANRLRQRLALLRYVRSIARCGSGAAIKRIKRSAKRTLARIPRTIPVVPNCTEESVTVTYRGAELTYGATGPRIPVYVRYRIGEGAEAPLFGGANLQELTVGATSTISLTGITTESLTIISEACFPNCESPVWRSVVESTDGERAIVSVNGDSLSSLATTKGFAGAFGEQQSISAITLPYLSPDEDTVRLQPNQYLLLEELGTTVKSSPAYDMQDVALLFTSSCKVESEVVVTDRITNATFSQGSTPITEYCDATLQSCGTEYSIAQTHISLPDAGVGLSEITALVDAESISGLTGDWVLRVYDSVTTLQNDPLCLGDNCQEVIFNYPTYEPKRVSGGIEVKFNLTPYNVTLPRTTSPEERLVSLSYRTSHTGTRANGNGTPISLVESLATLSSSPDTVLSNTTPYQEIAGRLSLALKGKLLPTIVEPTERNYRQDSNGTWASCYNVKDVVGNSCTDGRLVFDSNGDGFHSFGATAVKLVLTEPTVITRIAGVASDGGFPGDFFDIGMVLYVYSSPEAFAADPGNLSYVTHRATPLSFSVVSEFGGEDTFSSTPMYYVEIGFPEFTLQPGTYWVMAFRSNQPGGFYWGNSTVNLGSDVITGEHLTPDFYYLTDVGADTGTAAVDIFGRPAN